MSSHRTISLRIPIRSSTDGGTRGHSQLDSSAGLARVWLVAAALAVAAQASAQGLAAQPTGAAGQPRLTVGYGTLPLSFEANQGQSEERVKFLARGQGYSLFLTPTEAVLSLRAPAPHKPSAAEHAATGKRTEFNESAQPAAVVRMRLVGANTHPQLTGFDPLPGTSNYFIGNDSTRWQCDVPNYARVKYASVYPGIDLVYYGNQRQLEYDIVVAPGADPRRIALAIEGVQRLSLDPEGNLVLHTSQGDIAQHKPVIYQDIGGKRQPVDGRYVLGGKHRVGFQVASYDTTRPLIIDPVLSYSTYLGGNGNDIGYAIAVDTAGNAYVTGVTTSTNFPGAIASPIQPSWSRSNDVFVTKLNAAGSAVVYSTYLGGSGGDTGYAIAVDSTGNAYVTGETDSPTAPGPGNIPFPTAGAFQTSYNGGGDAFIAKINAAGNALVYSTYLGGIGNERGYGIAVDGSFNAYVTGHTSSSHGPSPSPFDFPTVAPFQSQNASPGGFDAFVSKINAAGSALVYSTYLGGDHSEFSLDGGAIAVDSDGNAYVGGTTASPNFPGASTSTIQSTFGGLITGRSDGFVVKFNAAGSALLYSTYLGGTTDDAVNGIAIDAARNAYVVGYTDSPDFPTALPLQASKGGPGEDAFVSKLNAAGSALVYSTYLGGTDGERAYAVAVNSRGNAFVSGWTASSNFPTVAPLQAVNAGSGDAFISELDPAGSALVYSTYLGGSTGSEHGYGIALDRVGYAYVTGSTISTNFPTAGPFQATLSGSADAFVAKVVGVAAVSGTFTDFNGDGKPDLVWRNHSTGQNVIWYMSGATFVSQVLLPTVPDTNWQIVAAADFNADGNPDLVWRNHSTGQNVVWYMSGATFVSQVVLTTVPNTDWQIVAAADFNADGNPDLVWRNHSTGQNVVWSMNGATFVSQVVLTTVPNTDWQIVAAADFNADGNPDLVWRNHSTGQNVVWSMNGATFVSQALLPTVADPSWYIGLVTDLNGDGQADIVWRNGATGQNVVWYLSGVTFVSQALLPTESSVRWDLAGARTPPATVGDFNADGQPDLLWRNVSTGQNVVWYMSGATFLSQVLLPTVPNTDWQSVATADLNGDGQTDIVWRNVLTGQNVVWSMSGATFLSQVVLPTVPDTNWEIVAAADFNADGNPDLVWRNHSTGQNVVWSMSGATFLSQVLLPTVPDTNWEIVAAADFNADGNPDLVWRNHSTGQNVVWIMNGATFVSQVVLPPVVDTNWRIAMAADFNADGNPDLVWRNHSTGQNVVWFMSGTTFVSQALLPTVADLNWMIR